jgi:SAM-dependent methyltransferase
LEKITAGVRKLYSRYPYPHYPLFASLRWQDGYMATSLFARRLMQLPQKKETRVLLAGCGEALPYIVRKWEPANHPVTCVDLSQPSLTRARIRLLWTPKRSSFRAEDLATFLPAQTSPFGHVDSYGVLHHLAGPTEIVTKLTAKLDPGATARFMIYNQPARRWITDIKHAFLLLGLDPYDQHDLKTARILLDILARHSESLRERLGPMRFSINNSNRLVDTFFHHREVRWGIAPWIDLFKRSGFEIRGLFDRYGELDDLENPLWTMPNADDLAAKAATRVFENNLELFLTYQPASHTEEAFSERSHPARLGPTEWSLWLKRPPRAWFGYVETKKIPHSLRGQLWRRFLHHLYGTKNGTVDDLAPLLPLKAMQRLARIGAILPGQISSKSLSRQLNKPMSKKETPETNEVSSIDVGQINELRDLLRAKLGKEFDSKKEAQILRRLGRAQL